MKYSSQWLGYAGDTISILIELASKRRSDFASRYEIRVRVMIWGNSKSLLRPLWGLNFRAEETPASTP